MKKIMAAAFICAASAFADWHQFPVIKEGMGEAKIAIYESRKGNSDNVSGLDYFRLRYSPVANLELLSEAYLKTGANHALGFRYQIIPAFLSAGVNVGVPIPKTNWTFTPHLQLSTPITSALTLGSFARVAVSTEEANDYTRGIDARAGVELDFRVGERSVLWAGFDIQKGINRSESDGEKVSRKEEIRGLGMYPSFGYLIVFGNMSLGTLAVIGLGEDAGNKPFSTTVGASASVKF